MLLLSQSHPSSLPPQRAEVRLVGPCSTGTGRARQSFPAAWCTALVAGPPASVQSPAQHPHTGPCDRPASATLQHEKEA